MKCFDSHAHLDMKRQSPDTVRAVLDRAFNNDIGGIVIIAGSDTPGEYDFSLALANEDERLFVAAGIHPHTATTATEAGLSKLERALDHTKIRALGEIGLDYHYNYSPPKTQRQAFIRQLKLAHQRRLPVVIHTREADDDTLRILKDEGAEQLGGVIHCFSGGTTLAEGALALGFYLSFSGIVTFPKATDIQEIATAAPSDRILAETDTPFLAPTPHRGRSNEPAWVKHVVRKLADLRSVDFEVMAETTWHNTLDCFRIKL